MDIKIKANVDSPESRGYLRHSEEMLNSIFSGITVEETMIRMLTQGTCVINVPEEGKAEYIELRDL